MPEYTYPLANGKTLVLHGETSPTDADVEAAATQAGVRSLLQAPQTPATVQPRGFDVRALHRPDADILGYSGSNFLGQMLASLTSPESVATGLGGVKALQAAPLRRLAHAGLAGSKGALAKTPILGPIAKGGWGAMRRSWQSTAPRAAKVADEVAETLPKVPAQAARMPQEAAIPRPAPSRPPIQAEPLPGPPGGFTPAAQRTQMSALTRDFATGRATTPQAVNQAIQRERRQMTGTSPTGSERRQPGAAGTTLGVYARPGAGSAKQIIRPKDTTIDLLTEKLREMIPGARVTRINRMPKPQTAMELDRAIRQRGHIDETMRKRPGLGSEAAPTRRRRAPMRKD